MEEDENIVKNTCKELGITQKELADRIGVDDGTVRKWSSSGTPPKWAVHFFLTIVELDVLTKKFDLIKQAHKAITE